MPNYYDHFAADNPFVTSRVNLELDKLDAQLKIASETIKTAVATELTIASGEITVTQTVHTVDTEGDASSDDLTDISGGEIGDVLVISAANSARTVVVKHDVTKIALADGADVSLTDDWKSVVLIRVSSTLWIELKSPSGGTGSTPSYVKVSDTKAKGTNGGNSVAASYQIRTLNTEDSDSDGICTLSSNQVTLDAGTYECYITAPAGFLNAHKAVLWNATASSLVLVGTSEFSITNTSAMTTSIIAGRFTVAAGQALEVRHYTQTNVTNGLGLALNINDPGGAALSEVYTVAEFRKVG